MHDDFRPETTGDPGRVPWGATAAGLGLVVLFAYSGRYARRLAAGRPLAEACSALAASVGFQWLVWLAFTPLVVRLCRRFPLRRGRWLRPLLAHLGAALVLASAAAAAEWPLARLVYLPREVSFAHFYAFTIQTELIFYAVIAGAATSLAMYREARAREAQAARLEALLREARMESVRRRVDPDFLARALDAGGGLLHEAPDRAEELIESLGDLMRLRTAPAGQGLVALGEELELAGAYLQVRDALSGGGLRVRTDIADDLLPERVPPDTLQPLLESVFADEESPVLHLHAARDAAGLVITARGNEARTGTVTAAPGLRELDERLHAQYGGRHRLEAVPGGVRLSLPRTTV